MEKAKQEAYAHAQGDNVAGKLKSFVYTWLISVAFLRTRLTVSLLFLQQTAATACSRETRRCNSKAINRLS